MFTTTANDTHKPGYVTEEETAREPSDGELRAALKHAYPSLCKGDADHWANLVIAKALHRGGLLLAAVEMPSGGMHLAEVLAPMDIPWSAHRAEVKDVVAKFYAPLLREVSRGLPLEAREVEFEIFLRERKRFDKPQTVEITARRRAVPGQSDRSVRVTVISLGHMQQGEWTFTLPTRDISPGAP